MKAALFLVVTFCFLAVAGAQSDAVISSVQQTLKDQGFYYGEVTGKKDADTTAAIRRYQIRNGLQITGELNAETQKSLGVKGAVTAPPRATPTAPPRIEPTPNRSNDLRDDVPVQPQPRTNADPFRAQPPVASPPSDYAPDPNLVAPQTSGIFDGTPYQTAPAEMQRRVILGAQTLLARRGYYRAAIDGEFGPGTEFALRAFQSRFGIEPSGRLNMETLAALGLLPGQQVPGVTAPLRRDPRRPTMMAPNGEPIYTPR